MEQNQTNGTNEIRIWNFISFSDTWREADTAIVDDIAPSWFKWRRELQENPRAYEDFINRLKREHAIETGVIERLYDLKKGITETFIKEGFVQSYLSHGDTNIPENQLMAHLRDHLDAVDFIFDVVKNDRPFTIGFIKELHALLTRHQDFAEGRDPYGNRLRIPLLKGEFKQRDNNPVTPDGARVYYCPPEHVDSEMENLIRTYEELKAEAVHPLVISAWLHHAFTTIHPFQDGNGRMARLLSSLIFIQHRYFPFTVLREEAKVKYIEALEQADQGKPDRLVAYFGEVQRRNMEKALNLSPIPVGSFAETARMLSQKLEQKQQRRQAEKARKIEANRQEIFQYCNDFLNRARGELTDLLGGRARFIPGSSPFDDGQRNHYFYRQIVSYAKRHDYFFNRTLPTAYFRLIIEFSGEQTYQLIVTLHHYGYDDSTLAIGAFLEYGTGGEDETEKTSLPLELKPHVISIDQDLDMTTRKPKLESYLNDILTVALAQIASELS